MNEDDRRPGWFNRPRRWVALAEYASNRTRMTPEEVLARYPGPVTLYASKGDTVVPPLLFALLCSSMFFLEAKGGKAVALAFGPLFLIYAAVNYFRDTTIELSAWGFATKDFGGAKAKCAWRAASEFKVKYGRGTAIQYVDANYDDAFFGPLQSVQGRYPFYAPVMCELLNRWRERALGISPP